jgi:hypothetical protein
MHVELSPGVFQEGFVVARADAMIGRERSFMMEIGIVPAAEPDGETDIDTE